MLELRGLSKNFGGVRAVDNLTITIAKGEIFGLIGPNGSGKSTTVNLICGLFSPSGGSIESALASPGARRSSPALRSERCSPLLW